MSINKIALKIASSQITIRDLLNKNIRTEIVISIDDSFTIPFSGPVKLTPDGVARWGANGTLNLTILLDNDEAIINDVLTHKQIQDVCSLFNTIAGHVNDDTYNKYIKN